MERKTGLCFTRFVFLTFRGPMASHDSNPYPDRSRIARYNATKLGIASRILYKLLLGENSTQSPKQDFVCRVAQKLANSWSTPRQLPTPWEVAGVFLAVVLWQHPIFATPKFRFLAGLLAKEEHIFKRLLGNPSTFHKSLSGPPAGNPREKN